ncbi:MAG: HIT domain-containing protein [Terriglobia bacterium]
MDYLWTPWRFQYIANIKKADRCVFCLGHQGENDERDFVLFRGEYNFIILNIFPYTSGHLMVAPFDHISDLSRLPDQAVNEMMSLAKLCKRAIEEVYHPDGFNIGMNLGRCAGAGVEHHLHLHIVPRWVGDANFMSVVGETRVLPDSLENTFQKLKAHLPPH